MSGAKPTSEELEARLAEVEERAQALAASQASADRERRHLEAVLEGMPCGVVILEPPDGRIAYTNERAAALYGRRPEPGLPMPQHAEALRLLRSDGSLFPPEELPASRALLRGEAVHNVEMVIERPGGRPITVLASAVPLRDAAGMATAAVGVFEDISDRKRMEKALVRLSAEAEQQATQLSAVFDSLPDPLIIFDSAGDPVRANAASLRMFGADVAGTSASGYAEAMGRLMPRRPDGRRVQPGELPSRRALRGETVRGEEYLVTAASGEELVLEVSAMPLTSGGKTVGAVAVWHDATERKQAEEAIGGLNRELMQRVKELKAAQDALQKAHDHLEHEVAARTADLHRLNQTLQMIIDCNEAIVRAAGEQQLLEEVCRIAVEVGGYRMAWVGMAEEDEARTVRPVTARGLEKGYLEGIRISWADNQYGRGPTGTAIRTGRPCIGRNFLTDPNLAPWREQALARGFQSSIALPLASGGRVFGALTIYAERPEAFQEEQVRVLTEMADDLAFGLGALRMQAERDQARRTAEDRAEQLRSLAMELTQAESRERRRLAQLLHDHLQQLLIGAKFRLGTLRSKSKDTELQQAADYMADLLDESIAASRSLTFELSPPVLYDSGLAGALGWLSRQMQEKYGLAVEVQTDAGAEPASEELRVFLFQAARELLLNVVKHASVTQAHVRLNRPDDNHVRIEVADEGLGFDPAQLRADSGGGFGLFSVRERLDLLGGRMEVTSAPGRGSRFALIAPLRPAQKRGEEAAAAAPAPAEGVPQAVPARSALAHAAPGGKIRVLLADDHKVMREGLARLLREQEDIEVIGQASDGRMALEMTRQDRPDVIIMDVSMPVMGGVEATRHVTAEFPETRVIGLSMHEVADMADAMYGAGAAAYLNKGGPPENLISAIRACRPREAAAKPPRASRRKTAARTAPKRSRSGR